MPCFIPDVNIRILSNGPNTVILVENVLVESFVALSPDQVAEKVSAIVQAWCSHPELQLSRRDTETVLAALKVPAAPNAELIRAGKAYRDAILSGRLKIS